MEKKQKQFKINCPICKINFRKIYTYGEHMKIHGQTELLINIQSQNPLLYPWLDVKEYDKNAY